MKKLSALLVVCAGLALCPFGQLYALLPRFSPEDISELAVGQKKSMLEMFKKERDQIVAGQKLFIEDVKKRSSDAERRLVRIKEELRQNPENEFLLKEQSMLNEWNQVLKEEPRANEAIIARLDENIAAINDYLRDPFFVAFKQEVNVGNGSTAYTFESAQLLNQKIMVQQKNVDQLSEQEKNALLEIENRRKLIATLNDTYKKHKNELEAHTNNSDSLGLSARQKGELFSVEEKLFKDKSTLEALRLRELEFRQELIKIKLFVAKSQLEILKEVFGKSKPFMRLTEAEVAYAKDELAKSKERLFTTIDGYQREIDRYIIREDELKEASKKYGVPLGADIDEWSREPRKNYETYLRFFEVASFNEQTLFARSMRDYLEAKKTREQAEYFFEELKVSFKESFYKMTARKLQTEELLTEEIKYYASRRAQIIADQAQHKSKRDNCNNLLSIRKRALENIKEQERRLVSQKEDLFKNHPREYAYLVKRLYESEKLIKDQIKILSDTADIYDTLINESLELIQQIDFVVGELEGMRLWHRSAQAISWQDLEHIRPDLNGFFRDLRTYTVHLNTKYVLNTVRAGFALPYLWLRLLLLLMVLLGLFGFRYMAPKFAHGLMSASQSYRGLRTISMLSTLFSGFFINYFISIASWIIIFAIGRIWSFPDPYFYVFFYLASILFFIYLANRFVRYLLYFNESRGYLVLTEDFQIRFALVLSVLLYATSIILLFRQAFMLVDYMKSGLPKILLALNIIILQIALILLLNKESFLSIIPTRTPFWEWLHKLVSTYYYATLAALIAVIILVNPYVGFGGQLFYVLVRVVGTVSVIYLLLWGHDILKRMSTPLFFQGKEDTVRERFTYAKTWYGLFVIAMLLSMFAVAIVFIAKFWNWPEGIAHITEWGDIKSWLTSPFLFKYTDYELSFFSLIKFILFFVVGLIFAFAFDRFVLDRMFDVLFVEPGVQHAVSSVTRYFIVFVAVISGFHSLGLGSHIWYFIIAAGAGLGFVIKDPIFDFISYFIILIQRPVKVGDYIRFDDDIRGTVRRITPRTVVLRRRNSTTVIVPNSQIMNRAFTNWNYSRGYTSFDDIFLTIEYAEDPAHVRDILLGVLRSNQYILKSPAPIVRLYRFGAYGYVFQVRGYLSSNYTQDMWEIAAEMRLAIAKALRDNNIKLGGIKPPDMLPGMTLGTSAGLPAEAQEHRTLDE